MLDTLSSTLNTDLTDHLFSESVWVNTHMNDKDDGNSNNVVCATSKASDQPAHTRSLIRTFASRLSII